MGSPPARLWVSHRCPGCGKSGWCSQHTETAEVWICMRGPAEGTIPRRNKHGEPYWLHLPPGMDKLPRLVAPPSPERAPATVLHGAYAGILARLPLVPEHREDLHSRGMSEEVILRHGIRSWSGDARVRAMMARELWREYGSACHGIPGWFVRDGKPKMAGGSGWCLPMWDISGRVVAIKIRGDGGYYYLSSSRPERGGPGAGTHARLAWPGRRMRPGDQADLVRVTEGEAKSIIAAELTGIPTISCPGVTGYREALPWLRLIGARRVLLAYDMDATTNPTVARALLACRRALIANGLQTTIETWGPSPNERIHDHAQ